MNEIPTFYDLYTWGQFTPVFVLVGAALLILMADTFLPCLPKGIYPIAGGLTAAVTACFLFANSDFGYSFIICTATALSLLLAYDYRKVMCESIAGAGNAEGTGEFNSLGLIAAAGACALTQAHDIITLFVSLETLTLSSYALAGYFRRNQGSVEAGVKYLVLGALSTGLLVFGAAWYFGMTGSFVLSEVCYATALTHTATGAGFMMALCFLLAGAFFKVGAAPLHVWIPDVYQGAPTPASSFLAAASKTAGFWVLLLVLAPLIEISDYATGAWHVVCTALAIVTAATLLIGNLGAIGQNNIKRLLGYSSIGQAGFILVFFVCGTGVIPNTAQYLLAYTLATVPAFYAAAMVRTQRGSEEISAFRGLGKTNPRTAFLITVLFASLAGVPLTLGFLAKFKAFMAYFYFLVGTGNGTGAENMLWLMIVMIICAAAGFYYYFKVLRAMYLDKPHEDDKPLCVPGITLAVMTLCVVALIALGTWPLLTGNLF